MYAYFSGRQKYFNDSVIIEWLSYKTTTSILQAYYKEANQVKLIG
jgi:hypothetical protein